MDSGRGVQVRIRKRRNSIDLSIDSPKRPPSSSHLPSLLTLLLLSLDLLPPLPRLLRPPNAPPNFILQMLYPIRELLSVGFGALAGGTGVEDAAGVDGYGVGVGAGGWVGHHGWGGGMGGWGGTSSCGTGEGGGGDWRPNRGSVRKLGREFLFQGC